MSVQIDPCSTIGRAGGGPGLLIHVSRARRPRLRVEGDDGHHFRLLLHWREMLNRTASRAYNLGSSHHAYLRGYPIPGGVTAWREEVARHLAGMRGRVDRWMAAKCLQA
jgi:hypothetical protein